MTNEFMYRLKILVQRNMIKNCFIHPYYMIRYRFGIHTCTVQLNNHSNNRYLDTTSLDRDAAGQLCLKVFGNKFNDFDLHNHISATYFSELISIYCKYE